MARLKIITEEEPLRKKSRPITEITDRIRTLLSDMLETMRDASRQSSLRKPCRAYCYKRHLLVLRHKVRQ